MAGKYMARAIKGVTAHAAAMARRAARALAEEG